MLISRVSFCKLTRFRLWRSRILGDMILKSKKFERQWSCLWHTMNSISRLVLIHHEACCCMDPQGPARQCLQRLLHITQQQLSFVLLVLSLCRSILGRFVSSDIWQCANLGLFMLEDCIRLFSFFLLLKWSVSVLLVHWSAIGWMLPECDFRRQ